MDGPKQELCGEECVGVRGKRLAPRTARNGRPSAVEVLEVEVSLPPSPVASSVNFLDGPFALLENHLQRVYHIFVQ